MIDLTAPIRAWHFTESATQFRDGKRIPTDGRWLVMPGKIVICERGLHFSRRAIDALQYAPGNTAHLVEVAGVAEEHSDKGVAAARRIISSVDAEKVLCKFACDCALDVAHLWKMPAIVREYLETQDGSKRAAAWAAAWDAVWAAASNAARDAARAAAWDAARAAARAAAWDAARDAARAAAWDAASDAAWDAARDAARDAAWAAQNTRLESALMTAMEMRSE